MQAELITIIDRLINVAPVLTHVPAGAAIPEVQRYTFDADATDVDVPVQPLTFSLADFDATYTVPSGAAIDPSTGVFTWTPSEVQGPGVYKFKVQVSDGVATTDQAVELTVTEVNTPPVLAPIGAKSVDEEVLLSFTVTASDPNDIPPNALTLSVTGLPEGASFNPATGLFTWTPTEAQQGSYEVTFRVTDDGTPNLWDEETITITVNGMVVLPTAKGGYSLLLRVNPTDPQQLELVNAKSAKTRFWSGPTGQTYSLTIVGLDNKSDTLTVDAANGPLTNLQQVFFDAKGGGAKIVDKLVIKNSAKNAPATNDRVEILADRVIVSGTAYLTEGLESISVDTGKGDDTIVVAALGKNVMLIDSAGTDTLDFSGATGGVGATVSLATGAAQKIFGGTTTLNLKGGFENATGTPYADKITGSSAANLIYGLGGDDSILGGAGNDTVYGGDGHDTIYGGAGNDALYGGEGNDWLYGDAGNDILQGGPGNNVLLGGAGNDALDVSADVTAGTGRNLLIGGAGLDSLGGGLGEDIVIGSTTKYDAKPLALAAIMEEWARDTDFALRQTHLTDGITVPGNPKLGLIQLVPKDKAHPKGTVLDDKAIDQLLGGPGDDWFFPFGNEVPLDG